MFGYRSDGVKLKNIPPFFNVIPLLMKTRNDSQVYYSEDLPISSLDEYIAEKASEGIKITYMHIFYAALVRMMAIRPRLNRFVINGRTYSRNGIFISLAIKKGLTDEGDETTLKIKFDGSENIFQVKERLENEILINKDKLASNNTDGLAKTLSHIPHFIMKFTVNFLIFLDKHGMLPKSIIALSPFHTSAFLTNVGSIGIDAIYHHLYNFGTTSLFLAMGKKKKSFVYGDDSIKEEKCISIALVGDERICDGFYFASSIKSFKKYIKNPKLLEENIARLEDNI